MVLDIEAAKTYLLQRNNEGKLNIEQLGVLGTGFGATLAIELGGGRLERPQSPDVQDGAGRQGLDPHLPRLSFKGVTVNVALKHRAILSQLSALTIVGQQDAPRYTDAKRIFKAFQQLTAMTDADALPFYEADTTLQGKELLYDRESDACPTGSARSSRAAGERGAGIPLDRSDQSAQVVAAGSPPAAGMPSVGERHQTGMAPGSPRRSARPAALLVRRRNHDRHADRQQLRIGQHIPIRCQDLRGALRVAQVPDRQ